MISNNGKPISNNNGIYKYQKYANDKLIEECFLNKPITMNVNDDFIKYQKYFHNLNGPAYIYYSTNNQLSNIEVEIYYENGKKHRTDGPARIEYFPNGIIAREYYYQNGCYNEKKRYYNNGNIREVEYLNNGRTHNLNGPALIEYDKYGNINREVYYVNGDRYIDDGLEWMVAVGNYIDELDM